jgi:hypothetical protein
MPPAEELAEEPVVILTLPVPVSPAPVVMEIAPEAALLLPVVVDMEIVPEVPVLVPPEVNAISPPLLLAVPAAPAVTVISAPALEGPIPRPALIVIAPPVPLAALPVVIDTPPL